MPHNYPAFVHVLRVSAEPRQQTHVCLTRASLKFSVLQDQQDMHLHECMVRFSAGKTAICAQAQLTGAVPWEAATSVTPACNPVTNSCPAAFALKCTLIDFDMLDVCMFCTCVSATQVK